MRLQETLRSFRNQFNAKRRHQRPKTRSRRRLLLEQLEERTTPTVLFLPQFGAETANYGGGPVVSNSWGMPIYTIFWGSYWGTTAGANFAASIENSINSWAFFSHYLDGLHQYGVNFPAGVSGSGTVQVFDYSDPTTPFNGTDVYNEATFGINSLGLPTPNQFSNPGVYFVITAPGANFVTPGVGGYHTYGTSFITRDGQSETFNFGWISTNGSLDSATYILSHETIETMTDPHGDAWHVLPSGKELCNNEAQNYDYRINSYLVQSFWSQSDGAYAVYDGNSQIMYVNNGVLTVNGDQLGVNFNDTITLDVVNGGVFVDLNGQTFQFEPGEISSVVVNTGGGTDTVNVLRTIVPVSLNYSGGAGTDVANFGTGGSVQGIQAPVTVFNGPSYTQVNIDDSSDGANHDGFTLPKVYISSTGVSGLAPAAINFTSFSINTLGVLGGTGTNTYTFAGAPASSSVVLHTGHAGSGMDTVNVLSAYVPLTINGDNGPDAINIGSQAPSLNGTLGNIAEPITVANTSSSSTLSLDDSGDNTARTGTISGTSITGLGMGASAAINYTGSQLASLTVRDSSGGATVAVTGTSTPTTLWDNGPATINIGSGGLLTGITAALILENEPATDTVNINDQNDPVFESTVKLATVSGKPYNFTGGQLSGLAGGVAPITWDYSDTAQVTLNTGAAGAKVTVLGAVVPTIINGNGATNTLVGGNLLTTWQVNTPNAGTLNNANANVTFTDFQNLTSGYGADGFYFANAATLSGTLNGGGGSGLSLAAYLTNLTVNITGGGLGNIPGVVGAFQGVQYVTTGSGNDSFIFSNTGSITSISSVGGTNTLDASAVNRSLSVSVYGTNAGTVPGMVFEFADIENFIGGSHNNTYVFSNGASLAGTLNGGSATNLIDMSPYISGLTFSVSGANSGSVAGVIGSFNHVQNLLGAGGGGNVFALSPVGSLSGELDGGFGGSNLLDYSAYTTGVTVNLSLNSATAVSGGVVNIQELRGGAGNDHLTGNGAGGTTFFASPGTDTIVGLGTGLVGTNANSNWSITGANAGKLVSTGLTTTYTGIQNLVGGTGVDVFKFSAAGTEVSINGGGGGDWLDYSGLASAVTVNLQAGTAQIGGGPIVAISNIQNVHGGNGGNTLTGNAQGNILIGGLGGGSINGGPGMSILIADKGSAAVKGGSANGDILIGDYTTFDTMTSANEAALASILAEWQSGDSLPDRFGDINQGLAHVGGSHKNGNNLLKWGTTVKDNGLPDNPVTVTAATATPVNWFFVDINDVMVNFVLGDHKNNS